jgi:hypothetical protein
VHRWRRIQVIEGFVRVHGQERPCGHAGLDRLDRPVRWHATAYFNATP